MLKPSQQELLRELTIRTQLSRFLDEAAEFKPTETLLTPSVLPEIGSESLQRQLLFLDSVVQHAPEGIVVLTPGTDDDGPHIGFVNEGFCRLTGMTREEVIGETPRIFRVAESDSAVLDALLHPLCQRRGFEGEAVAYRKNGTRYVLELLVIPIYEASGDLRYWVCYLRDVTERRAQLAALEHQSLHDILTDLPNRLLLRDRLEQALLAAAADNTAAALLSFDLDGFKEINDEYGHHIGDLLLQQVGPRIRKHLRPLDTLARLGGDEFGILLPVIGDARDALKVAAKLSKAFETPFVIQDQTFEVGASIGVAAFPGHGNDAATILRAAEVAMYAAKQSRNGYLLYSPDLEPGGSRNLTMKVDLREAIEQNQLVLFYQPKVHLRSGLVTRVEALVRWRHPERGLIFPDQFIPVAERTALIKTLTDWVLDEALKQCRQWHEQGVPLHVAVNLSTQSLQEPFLPERISKLLQKWQVEPRVLKLEITESSIMNDPPHVLAVLALLRSLGVRLSLDDFGTGYSSLMHLRHLPVDEIKIDKSFVMGMKNNESDAAIVRAIIDLAHNLGHEVVAEGVDDADTYKILNVLGCDLAQGYYLSPPLPPDELIQWLTDSRWGMSHSGRTTDPARLQV